MNIFTCMRHTKIFGEFKSENEAYLKICRKKISYSNVRPKLYVKKKLTTKST